MSVVVDLNDYKDKKFIKGIISDAKKAGITMTQVWPPLDYEFVAPLEGEAELWHEDPQ